MSEPTRDELDIHKYVEGMKQLGWTTWEGVDEDYRYYWWDDGEPGVEPIPVHVMRSKGGFRHFPNCEYFANKGQHGWGRPQPVEEMQGWWMKIDPPKPLVDPRWEPWLSD